MNKERKITIRVFTTDELPDKVGGGCMKIDDGDNYVMAINGTRDERTQVLDFLHECLHIWYRDIDSGRTATEIEAERRRELRELVRVMQ